MNLTTMHSGEHSLSCQADRHESCRGCDKCWCHPLLSRAQQMLRVRQSPVTRWWQDVWRTWKFDPFDRQVDWTIRERWRRATHHWYEQHIMGKVR